MKSANRSLFVAVGIACGLVLGGNVGCNVSADGLGTAMEPIDDSTGGGGTTGGSLGEGGDMQPGVGGSAGTGGVVGTGGMVGTGGVAGMTAGGGAGGMRMGGVNAGGARTGGMNAGGAATGGMNAGGAATGGMNAGGTAGMNVGGTAGMMGGPTYNTDPTPGEVKCGTSSCDSNSFCCLRAGKYDCVDGTQKCPGGGYRECDDRSDCGTASVCCGDVSTSTFRTLCLPAATCFSAGQTNTFSLCATRSQCSGERLCCAFTNDTESFGVCRSACP